MDYQLVRSKRKTLAIRVTADAAIEVRAPLRLSAARIEEALLQNEAWIRENVAQKRVLLERKRAFSLTEGTRLPLLGTDYPLHLAGNGAARLEGGRILLPLEPDASEGEIRREAEAFYRTQAVPFFSQRAADFGKRMGKTPTAVKISGAAKQWGSCAADGTLRFSWRLLRAPAEAVDYVVVHELAHLFERNHAKRFWAVVAAVFPDYRERRKLLLPVEHRLLEEGWNDVPS